MIDVYVLNKDLEVVGVIDAYNSLIWANRYKTTGDCELYLPATTESLNLLQKGFFLMRPDDDMVCQIRKIELDTDVENGNFLVVSGYDSKIMLDQRIIMGTANINGSICEAIYKIVQDAVIDSEDTARIFFKDSSSDLLFAIGEEPPDLIERATEQVSYKNIGEKIRDYCDRYGWGYKVRYSDSDAQLVFELYRGTDRTGQVIFSEDFENLSTTKYIEDDTNLGNVALVGGEGEGSARARALSGMAYGVERFEIYVDAKNTSRTVKYADLVSDYPGGTITSTGSGYTYHFSSFSVQVLGDYQLDKLYEEFPDGYIQTIAGFTFYVIPNVDVADLPSATPADEDDVILRDVIYDSFLLNAGYEKLALYGATTSFEGTIEPGVTFEYKKDYFLGDLVTVQNNYGISVSARIVEVVEVEDDNGYSVEPKFEYIEGV